MATTPSGVSPAEAMPVAFSARYLFWGADNWRDGSVSHILARELYSFGVAIVAPIGIFYHLCMAAYGALAQLVADDKKELSTWTWQHLEVAKFDLMAWGSILVSVVLATTIIAFAIFAFSGEFLFALLSLSPFLLLLLLPPEDILSVGYAIDSSWFYRLLSCEPADGARSSQADFYRIRMFLGPDIANGSYVLDTPLQDEEIANIKLDRIDLINGDPFTFGLINMPSTMNYFGRTPPHMQPLIQKLRAKRNELEKLRADYLNEHKAINNNKAQNALMKQADKLLDGALSNFEKERKARG